MENENVVSLNVVDDTGVRKNVTEILDHLRKGDLTEICILWQTKDGTLRCFENGDDLVLMGMLAQQTHDIASKNVIIGEHIYEKSLHDDDNDENETS